MTIWLVFQNPVTYIAMSYFLYVSVNYFSGSSILFQKPQMIDVIRKIIPKIAAEWENVAYALHFDIPKVEFIAQKSRDDPMRCCKELFKVWLSTDQGASPKTWATLLNQLKQIHELTATEEHIRQQLLQES